MITEFFKPATVSEAVELKIKNPDALFMAGGAWINSSRSPLSPEKVISLEGLELTKSEKSNDMLIIGACTTLQDLLDAETTPEDFKENIFLLKNRNLRNQGTIGGTIAAKQACFPMIPYLIAVGADLVLANGKVVPVEEYVSSLADNLILNVRLPLNVRAASAKHSVTAQGVALVSVAAAFKNGKISLAYAQDGGKIEHPVQIERVLNGNALPKRDILEKIISQDVVSFDDYRTSADFKTYIIGVLAAECILKVAQGDIS